MRLTERLGTEGSLTLLVLQRDDQETIEMTREGTGEKIGLMMIRNRNGKWCIGIEARPEWRIRRGEAAQQLVAGEGEHDAR